MSRKATDILARVQRTVASASPISTSDDAATADTPPAAPRRRRPPAPERPASPPRPARPAPARPPAAQVADQTPAPPVRRSGLGRRRRRQAGDVGPGATRYTVDLETPLHRTLHVFALDHQADASEVVRALIRRLDQDPALAAAVVEELEAGEEEVAASGGGEAWPGPLHLATTSEGPTNEVG